MLFSSSVPRCPNPACLLDQRSRVTMRPDSQNQNIRSLLTRSSGTRPLDSPEGSLEIQRPVATHEGGDVLGQDEAFLVERRLSQEGGEEAKGHAQLGLQ